MEYILRKREQKLIKEGINFIDSFEEYTRKNNPDIYKKYLDLRDKKLISFSDKWRKNMIISILIFMASSGSLYHLTWKSFSSLSFNKPSLSESDIWEKHQTTYSW